MIEITLQVDHKSALQGSGINGFLLNSDGFLALPGFPQGTRVGVEDVRVFLLGQVHRFFDEAGGERNIALPDAAAGQKGPGDGVQGVGAFQVGGLDLASQFSGLARIFRLPDSFEVLPEKFGNSLGFQGLLFFGCRSFLGPLQLKTTGGNFLKNLPHLAHRMADPRNPALMDYKSRGDAALLGGLHPVFRHERVRSVHRNGVIHLLVHFFDKSSDRFCRIVAAFPDVHADKRHLGKLVRKSRQVGDGCAAGRTPGGPKFDHISALRIKAPHFLAFDPLRCF